MHTHIGFHCDCAASRSTCRYNSSSGDRRFCLHLGCRLQQKSLQYASQSHSPDYHRFINALWKTARTKNKRRPEKIIEQWRNIQGTAGMVAIAMAEFYIGCTNGCLDGRLQACVALLLDTLQYACIKVSKCAYGQPLLRIRYDQAVYKNNDVHILRAVANLLRRSFLRFFCTWIQELRYLQSFWINMYRENVLKSNIHHIQRIAA